MAALRHVARSLCSAIPRAAEPGSGRLAAVLERGHRSAAALVPAAAGRLAGLRQGVLARHLTAAAGGAVGDGGLLPQARGGGCLGSSACGVQIRGLKAVSRDPERPRRPMTPWLRFLQHFRSSHPELPGSSVMKTAAAAWKDMKPEGKRPYEEAYTKDKTVFDTLFTAYKDSGKKDAWERPPGKPKKPQSAFFQFAQEYRSQHPKLKPTEVAQTAAVLWKDMSPEKKRPYEQQFERAKEQYAKDLKAYEASGAEAAWKEKVGITAAEEKKKAAAEKKKAAAEKKRAQEKRAAAAEKKGAAREKKAAVTADKPPAAGAKAASAGAAKKPAARSQEGAA